jgi:glycosidase
MKMNILFSLIISALLSCSKKEVGTNPAPPPPPPPAAEFTQYGTPFSAVPDPADAIIYQVNMRAFSAQGNFAGVQNRLDSIKALGVNVIYLMPYYPVGILKSVNSPYCIKDFYSVATEFGTLDNLRSLITEAHNRNIAVIADWVADHTSWDNDWITKKDWYKQDANGNIISPPNTGWADVAALNFNNYDMRNEMIHAMKYWIYTTNIDGYRCDAADFIPYDFWKQAIDSLKAIGTHKLLMFAEGTRSNQFTAGFQLEYGMGFFNNMKDQVFAKGKTVKSIDSVNNIEYPDATIADQVVRYTSNHDVNSSDGTPQELFGGTDGSIATFAVAALMKGIPMIYNGQEIGYPIRLNYFNNSTPITWTYNTTVTPAYKKMLAFRNGNDAVKKGMLVSYSSDDVCVFTKTSGSQSVLVLVNLRNNAAQYQVPTALQNTNWKDGFDNSTVSISNQVSLQPYQYMVLKN